MATRLFNAYRASAIAFILHFVLCSMSYLLPILWLSGLFSDTPLGQQMPMIVSKYTTAIKYIDYPVARMLGIVKIDSLLLHYLVVVLLGGAMWSAIVFCISIIILTNLHNKVTANRPSSDSK